jgi:hypothetical protein
MALDRAELKRRFLLSHPPAGGVDGDPAAPDPKTDNPVLVDSAKLGDAIAAGLARSLPEAMRAAERDRPDPVLTRTQPAIQDVDDEEIFAAVEAGDKAKAAALRRQQRNADRERIRREDLSPILTGGRAAIGQLAELGVKDLPHYKTYQKEILVQIEKFKAANPEEMITPDIFRAAYTYVVGEHADEIASAAAETAIRKSKEPDPALTPGGRGGVGPTEEETEPKTLTEALGSDWKDQWKRKSHAPGVRGRTEDGEMEAMGFGSVAGFLARRKELAALEETTPSLGLDAEWNEAEKRWYTPAESRRLPLPQE